MSDTITASLSPSSFKADATVISLVGFAHGTSHFFHLMFPALFPFLIAEFNVGYAKVGTLTMVFFVVSGVGQAIAGIWVDKFGAHRVLCVGISLLTLSAICVALSANFTMLMFAAAIAGAGNSVFHPADFALINHRVSVPRLGHAFSVHGLSGNLGWALSPLLMVAVATMHGWRMAGLVAALFGALALLFLIWKRHLLQYAVLVKQTPGDGGSSSLPSHIPTRFINILRLPMVWAAFAFFFFATFGFGALQNFAPSLLSTLFGLSLATATSALSIYLIGSAAGLVLGGFLARPGNKHEGVVAASFGIGALLALSFAFVPYAGWMVLPLMAVMGFAVGIAGPSRDLLVRTATKAQLGDGAFGRVYGMVYSGLDAGLALAPIAFGILLDATLPRLVFVCVAASMLIAIIAAWAVARLASGTRGNAPHESIA